MKGNDEIHTQVVALYYYDLLLLMDLVIRCQTNPNTNRELVLSTHNDNQTIRLKTECPRFYFRIYCIFSLL